MTAVLLLVFSFWSIPFAPKRLYSRVRFRAGVMFWVVSTFMLDSSVCVPANRVPQ